jgi:hypothetical protein
MHGHSLIFSRSGGPDRLYRVSPLLFPQSGLNNKYFLPSERDVPLEGLETRFQTFDFGFAIPGTALTPYDTGHFGITFGRNFLAELITGCSVPAASAVVPVAGAPGAKASPEFLFNFNHENAKGAVRLWSQKPLKDTEGLGTAEEPMVFKSPVLILAGDTLTCEVRSLVNATLQVQIVLIGGEFE